MTRKDHSEVSNQLYANYAIGKDVQVRVSQAHPLTYLAPSLLLAYWAACCGPRNHAAS